jgi:uncharacterized membrane protein
MEKPRKQSMNEQELDSLIKKQVELEYSEEIPSLKERSADIVAEFGGSWMFLSLFTAFFVLWIVFNLYAYSFDGYPFILLNLILSCLSVFQAPFILMSQNRLSGIDRKRSDHAYKVSLKAEKEIKLLHEKMDLIINESQARAD